MAHEAGHNLATRIWGSTEPDKNSEYGVAQQREPAVSDYGSKSSSEDFAEAVKMYSKDPESLKQNFPLKFAALRKIIG
jgi:Mlc titration factor MtfA (ptsG expression regulator)